MEELDLFFHFTTSVMFNTCLGANRVNEEGEGLQIYQSTLT